MIPPMILLISAALLAGLAVGIAAWAGRTFLQRKFEHDCHWMRETFLRFDPEPINAPVYTMVYYGACFFLLLFLLWAIPSAPIAFVIWLLCLLFPKWIVQFLWRRRLKRIDFQIPQTVSTLANSMRAGLTLVQAITRLSEQAPEPIRGEFKIMANQYAYGADMESVIRNAKARLGLPNFTLFASALLLNREMGGDISETLIRISKSLDKLREMRKTVEAHTSEGRTNIKVLLVMPVLMLALMSVMVPRGVAMLFTTLTGMGFLAVAVLLAGAGVYIANRITRSEI